MADVMRLLTAAGCIAAAAVMAVGFLKLRMAWHIASAVEHAERRAACSCILLDVLDKPTSSRLLDPDCEVHAR